MTTLRSRWAFLDWPGPIPFAHRGGGIERPENTMAAFTAAVELGYRYVETDARTTADGMLVAFHDETLDRVTDREGAVATLPFEEVRRARVDGEPIPLLEDVLGSWPDVRVYVDAKDDQSVLPLVAALARTRAHDRVCVGSFCNRRANRLRRLTDDRVCTWMGWTATARLRLASFGIPTGGFSAACTQAPVCKGPVRVVDRTFIDAARRRGVAVHVWTIDDRQEMERLLDLGVDGILSNRPSLLKEVFCERGLWI